MNLFRAIFSSCQQVGRLQSEALDHSLPLGSRVTMQMHLLVCNWCRLYGKQIRFLHCATHEHGEKFQEAAPQSLSAESRERIKDILKREAKSL